MKRRRRFPRRPGWGWYFYRSLSLKLQIGIPETQSPQIQLLVCALLVLNFLLCSVCLSLSLSFHSPLLLSWEGERGGRGVLFSIQVQSRCLREEAILTAGYHFSFSLSAMPIFSVFLVQSIPFPFSLPDLPLLQFTYYLQMAHGPAKCNRIKRTKRHVNLSKGEHYEYYCRKLRLGI